MIKIFKAPQSTAVKIFGGPYPPRPSTDRLCSWHVSLSTCHSSTSPRSSPLRRGSARLHEHTSIWEPTGHRTRKRCLGYMWQCTRIQSENNIRVHDVRVRSTLWARECCVREGHSVVPPDGGTSVQWRQWLAPRNPWRILIYVH